MAKTLNTVSTTSHASQSVMARILASENINIVVDPKMQTAAFDLKNRTLLLPQWKDMSKAVYDMLIGHEISHALHTPVEGWRDTCIKIGGTTDSSTPAYQTASMYLNVIEDARIERLIQIKFPGFKRDFVAAYNDLNNKNFFGIKGVDMNTLTLADRINLYYKLGTIGSVGINFTADEDQFIRRIDSATTFADAAQIAEDLFNFCNEQKNKNKKQNGTGNPPPPCNGGKSNDEQSDENDDQSAPSDSAKSDDVSNDNDDAEQSNQGGDEQSSGSGDAQDADKEDSKEEQQSEQSTQGSESAKSEDKKDDSKQDSTNVGTESSQSDVPPAPVTQKNLERHLQQQTQSDKYSNIVCVPTKLVHCNLDEVVIDCKTVVATAASDYPWMFKAEVRTPSDLVVLDIITKKQETFMRDSKKQIDLLMKQFELRKNAQIAKRESVRKTGILDTVRMVNYKHSEDIFRRNTMLPEGKNHGLVMFVDWSGSMSACLEAVVEQTMVLVEFCRRMSIPYEVYAFTTRDFNSETSDINTWNPGSEETRKKFWQGDMGGNYSRDTKEEMTAAGFENPRAHNEFSLMNLLSSRLTRTEHQNMMMFLRALTSRNADPSCYFNVKNCRWELSGTALDETIVSAMQIVPKFKEANRLDIVNTIFLTDGETSIPYMNGNQLVDPKTKAVYSADQFASDDDRARGYNSAGSTDILLLALRDITKANVVGMFLTNHSGGINVARNFRKELRRQKNMIMAGKKSQDKYEQMQAEREAQKILGGELAKRFNEDNCVVAEEGTTGYSEYFIIKSNVRVLGDQADPMDSIQQGATQAAVKKAFLKSFENKNKSRVLINRFIELIAR